MPKIEKAKMSFSGSERNSLFLKSDQGYFSNVSGVSGFDSPSDGRCLAALDIDRDGLLDLLVTNANKPTLAIFKNKIGTLQEQKNFVAIKVVGGNKSGQSSTEFTNRDGIGALIRVTTSEFNQIREVRCGEGLATQAGRIQLFGIGVQDQVESIEVDWPSGKTNRIENVAAGRLVEVYENQSEVQGLVSGARVSNYGSKLVADRADPRIPNLTQSPIEIPPADGEPTTIVIGMATWCDKCIAEIANLKSLKQKLGNQVRLLAIPIDKDDSQEKLDQFQAKYQPPYNLQPNQENAVKLTEYVVDELGSAKTPFSVVLSPGNKVLLTKEGIPTISDLRKVNESK